MQSEELLTTGNKPTTTTTTTTTFLQEFIAGNIGGVASVFAAQPADTIKVRLQTAPVGTFQGTIDCAKQTIAKEGAFSLYKGIIPPLVGVGFINACLFAANGTAKNWFLDLRTKQTGTYQTELSISDVAYCGAFAGFAQSAVAGPIELLKTRLQIDRSPSGARQSPLDLVKMLNQKVGVRWMGMGMGATIAREIPGYAGYFAVYEALKRKLTNSSMNPSIASLISGGSAGVAYWSICLPMDVLKSRLQGQHVGDGPLKYKNSIDCAKQLIREEGMGALYKGYSASIMRTIPSSAVCFVIYEAIIKAMTQ